MMNHYEHLDELTTERNPIEVIVKEHTSMSDSLFDMHYEMEIGILLEGCITRFYNGEAITYTPGQIWFHGIMERHGFSMNQCPARMAIFFLNPVLIHSLSYLGLETFRWYAPFYCPPSARPQPTVADYNKIFALAEKAAALSNANSTEKLVGLQLILLELCLTAQKDWNPSIHPVNNANRMLELHPAIEYVFGTSDYISANEAANLCNMSRQVFESRFRKFMNISFADFALSFRLKKAGSLLLKSGNIKETALSTGFSDVSHFYRRFKSQYGCTPAEYLERLNK